MKASVCLKYGSPDILSIKEVEKPTPGDHEVLIKVYATTVNRTDLYRRKFDVPMAFI
jgi:NADPH:quinone reductase-like Zn-dependent oxidoreductase